MARSPMFTWHWVVLFVGAAIIFVFRDSDHVSRVETPFIPPVKGIEHFTFGNSEIFADMLWLRVIQDIDHCEGANKMAAPEALAAHPAGKKCEPTKFGWVFHMIDSITTLAPKFQIAYIHGGNMLSSIIHDGEGATVIFDHGVEHFPKVWTLEYAAAYHQMSEMHDSKRAADLLVMAGRNGAPKWVDSLAGRLYSEVGQAQFAKKYLEDMIAEDPDSRWVGKLKQRLEEVEAVIAKGESQQNPAPPQKAPASVSAPEPAAQKQ